MGVLGVDRLASDEEKRHSSDANDLIAATDQMHFNPFIGGVVQGSVDELIEVEVSVEFAIDCMQDVAIERGCDPLSVVVGGFQQTRVFPPIDAEQESAVASAQN